MKVRSGGRNGLVIIPAYNEADNIGFVIKDVKEKNPELDILVVNDGSSDNTRNKVIDAGAKVLTLSHNLGYGAALQTGYKYALGNGYDFVIQLDADRQHDPKYIKGLLCIVKNGEADIVIGSRFLKKKGTNSQDASRKQYKLSINRAIGLSLFRFICSLITKMSITDPTSGYRAFNKKVLKLFVTDAYPVDYPDADVLLMSYRAGLKIKETPVIMYESISKKSMHSGHKPLYYIFKMFLSILVILLRKKPKEVTYAD